MVLQGTWSEHSARAGAKTGSRSHFNAGSLFGSWALYIISISFPIWLHVVLARTQPVSSGSGAVGVGCLVLPSPVDRRLPLQDFVGCMVLCRGRGPCGRAWGHVVYYFRVPRNKIPGLVPALVF